jgi:hypothetical protein
MPRRPGDTEQEPPGGRAAERLREFIDQRFPDVSRLREGKEAVNRRDDEDEEPEAADPADRQNR